MNTEKLNELIGAYKAHFNEYIGRELYKWKAVKCFQDNWDIDAADFASMLSSSLSKTENFLVATNYYPRRMMEIFAELYPEEVRSAFKVLFDESEDLKRRIENFVLRIENIHSREKSKFKQHFQSYSAISVYLWLRYPNKYYFFKPTIVQKVFNELSVNEKLRGKGVDAIIKCYEVYDKIADRLKQDGDVRKLLDGAITSDCYADTEMRTIVIDFAFYVGKYRQFETKNIEKGVKILEEIQKDDKNLKIIYNSWDDAIIRVLGDSDKPLKARDISKIILDNKYYKTNGKTPERTISTNLTQNPKRYYEGVGGASYALSDLGQQKYQELKNIIIDKKEDEADVNNIEIKSEEYYYDKTKFLEEVFMSDNDYDKLHNLLLRKKNIILQGAPGVGKTFVAKRLAYSIIGNKNENCICHVQFHQNYSYEDFIMGYKPKKDKFILRKGIFYDFCTLAKNNSKENYFFIIDEINRGNLSKIFGELLMLIENNYRGDRHKIRLAYNNEEFYVPKNLYIIGMMNTADRSLAMIDYALRRRFSFFEMKPGFETEGFNSLINKTESDKFKNLIEQIKKLNNQIVADDSLGKGFEIGHSYFCFDKKEDVTDEWLLSIVDYDIIPMLEEYWFDNRENVNVWSKKLREIFEK